MAGLCRDRRGAFPCQQPLIQSPAAPPSPTCVWAPGRAGWVKGGEAAERSGGTPYAPGTPGDNAHRDGARGVASRCLLSGQKPGGERQVGLYDG